MVYKRRNPGPFGHRASGLAFRAGSGSDNTNVLRGIQEPLPPAAAVLARRFGLTAATAALVVELAGLAEGRP